MRALRTFAACFATCALITPFRAGSCQDIQASMKRVVPAFARDSSSVAYGRVFLSTAGIGLVGTAAGGLIAWRFSEHNDDDAIIPISLATIGNVGGTVFGARIGGRHRGSLPLDIVTSVVMAPIVGLAIAHEPEFGAAAYVLQVLAVSAVEYRTGKRRGTRR